MTNLKPLNIRRDPNLKCPACGSEHISLVDLAFDSATGEMHQTGNTHQCDQCNEYFQYIAPKCPRCGNSEGHEIVFVLEDRKGLKCGACGAGWTQEDPLPDEFDIFEVQFDCDCPPMTCRTEKEVADAIYNSAGLDCIGDYPDGMTIKIKRGHMTREQYQALGEWEC